jgi:hypothetical protein
MILQKVQMTTEDLSRTLQSAGRHTTDEEIEEFIRFFGCGLGDGKK